MRFELSLGAGCYPVTPTAGLYFPLKQLVLATTRCKTPPYRVHCDDNTQVILLGAGLSSIHPPVCLSVSVYFSHSGLMCSGSGSTRSFQNQVFTSFLPQEKSAQSCWFHNISWNIYWDISRPQQEIHHRGEEPVCWWLWVPSLLHVHLILPQMSLRRIKPGLAPGNSVELASLSFRVRREWILEVVGGERQGTNQSE